MRQRIITAIFFVAAMLGGVYYGRDTFFALFLIIAAGCLWELLGLLLPEDESHRGFRRIAGCLLGVLPVLIFGTNLIDTGFCGLSTLEEISDMRGSSHFTAAAFSLASTLFLLAFLIIAELFLAGKTPFTYIGHYLTGVFYISLPTGLLFSVATPDALYSPNRVFGLLLLVWTNDSMAYFIGSQLGKHKLFERISPKKTWEGAIGGGICTMLIAWGLSFYFKDFTTPQWVALAAVAAVFGTLGDLVESMLKRSVGVKDSGNLLPGHGGLLDRFDAFIFALPFYWLVLQIV